MMEKVIYGKKLGMSQHIDADGIVTPVTLVKVMPLTVIKKLNNNKVDSILIGMNEVEEKKLNKPKIGLFKKNNTKCFKYIREFKLSDIDSYNSNDEIGISNFEENEKIHVRGKNIGKGFAGTIKRHHFSRGPMTHGSKNHRLPGSIGGGTDPGRVFKGTKMGGRLGNKYITMKNLIILKIDSEKELILIKGSIPGKKNNLVEIFN
ncbi:50S ribosomal protein L3 [Candidatus Marinamargulisbacteria bacterium SCGC AAA071-K20]|nr:50S ribosomal protein L3 [Candidatus Marinamargulisbacteria bacterium SCGC AAA071-K20]